jgi:murein DD-endopeptidase MepM/ murein hydrolase activator NlpD
LIAVAALVTAALVTVAAPAGRWSFPESLAPLAPAGGDGPGAAEAVPPPTPEPVVRRIELKRGDSFVGALSREGINHALGNTIAAVLKRNGANLRRLRPRDTIEVRFDPDGEPVEVRWEPSPWRGYAAVATDSTWEVQRLETTPDIRVAPVVGEVTRSLFQAVEAAGATPRVAIDFVNIFESEFDFAVDTRTGDRFRMLVERRYAGDSFVDHGRVLAAQYQNGGRLHTGIGFEHAGRFAYYDLDGHSLRKTFLRAPLEYTRISSGFTRTRVHPILGGIRPHLAVDYAAPVGTPVRAVADGTVLRAGWAGGNGIMVVLRHRSGYETMYLHLSRLGAGVRAGVRVRQRQVIGYVGATGLATGPHLCYRVKHDGQFVNPLNEKFLPGEPIPASARQRFQEHARTLLEQLERDAFF